MKEGEIILVNILTSEGNYKKRPALILKVLPKFNDLLLCGISSQIQQIINDFDLLLSPNSIDFQTSGIIKESIIRLGYLTVLPQHFVEGKIGYISNDSHKLLIQRLCDYLSK